MKLFYIQIPINKSKDILITICIWIKGTHEKMLSFVTIVRHLIVHLPYNKDHILNECLHINEGLWLNTSLSMFPTFIWKKHPTPTHAFCDHPWRWKEGWYQNGLCLLVKTTKIHYVWGAKNSKKNMQQYIWTRVNNINCSWI